MTKQHPKFILGFSLAELCCTLVIIGVIYQICLPKIKPILEHFAHQRVIHTLQSTLSWAQNKSWQRNQTLRLCPMKNNQCVTDWTLPIQIYGANHQAHNSTQTLKVVQLPDPTVQVTWQRKLPLIFHPRGWVSNSHFRLESKSLTSKVIVSTQGRNRVTRAHKAKP